MYATSLDHGYLRLAEPPTSSWRSVHARFQALARRHGTDAAEEARCIREAEHLRIWVEVGEPSMAAYLARMLGYGPRCAYDRLRVARALGELPCLELALEHDEIFYSIVRELTRVAIWETEAEWLEATRGKSLREVEGMVSGRRRGDRPDAPPDPKLVRHVLHHEVSAETYALFRAARKSLQDEVGEQLDDDTFLAMLAKRALEPGASDGKSTSQTMMTICTECRRGWQDGAGAVVEIPRETVEQVECGADRLDAKGNITRHIPARTRRAVLARDHHRCRVPWCRSPHSLEPHHVTHFGEGGGHDADNLVTLCWHHHRAHHTGKLRIFRENGRVEIERIDTHSPTDGGIVETAERALVGMGFKKGEARSLVATAIAPGGNPTSLAELIREALRRAPAPS